MIHVSGQIMIEKNIMNRQLSTQDNPRVTEWFTFLRKYSQCDFTVWALALATDFHLVNIRTVISNYQTLLTLTFSFMGGALCFDDRMRVSGTNVAEFAYKNAIMA